MKDTLGDASSRTLGIAMGLFFGAGMGVWSALTHPELPILWHVVLGLLAGAAFGAVMGRLMVRQRDGARALMGDLDDQDRAAAVRAADRGTVPDDPELAAAAARLVGYRIDTMARQRRWSLPFFVVITVVAVVMAITSTPWWWAGTVVSLLLVGMVTLQPRRLEQRRQSLQRGATPR